MKNLTLKVAALALTIITFDSINAMQLRPIDTALFNAVKSDKSGKFVTLAIEEGANPLARDNEGYTPLHWAARSNNRNVVLYLLSKTTDTKQALADNKNKLGLTPLQWATLAGNHDVINALETVAAREAASERIKAVCTVGPHGIIDCQMYSQLMESFGDDKTIR